MSMFSNWTSKAKTYYDEKVTPEGGSAKAYADKGETLAKDVNKTYRQMQYLKDTLEKGPKGSTGQFVDSLYGGTFKDLVKGSQGKSNEDSSGNSAADEQALSLLRSSRRGLQGRGGKVKGERDDNRRGLSNFNTKTLLTQGQRAKKIGPQ